MLGLFSGIFIVGARRTPFGAMGGALTKLSPTDLQEIAAKAALADAKVDPQQVDTVVIGNCISVSVSFLITFLCILLPTQK